MTLVVSLLGLFPPAPRALAQKVGNPGNFTLTLTGGLIDIGGFAFDLTPSEFPECNDGIDNEGEWPGGVPDRKIDYPEDPQCTALEDDSELREGFQPKLPTTLSGGIDKDGAVVVPKNGVNFPPVYMGSTGQYTVQIVATHDATGTLNPLSGDVELNIRLRATVKGFGLGDSCSIGTPEDPIDATLITGTTNPPPPNKPISGVPYDPETATATIVDNSFGVPGASGCGPFGSLNWIINGLLGLPSPPGTNTMIIEGEIDPVITKGVNAVIKTDPDPPRGYTPFDITFNGSRSRAKAGIASYDWDFGDGSPPASGKKVTHRYTKAGTYTTTLEVTDNEGDVDVATVNVSVVVPEVCWMTFGGSSCL